MSEERRGNAVRITSITVVKAQRALDAWIALEAGKNFTPERIKEVTQLIRECHWAAVESDDHLACAFNFMKATRDRRNTQEHLRRIGIDTISIDPVTGRTYAARANRPVRMEPQGAA